MFDSDSSCRYERHFRRIQLGLRLLAHGARAHTASEWSGLTPDRLVTLKRRWLPKARNGFRGPAPTSFQVFWKSAGRSHEATIFASIHHSLSQLIFGTEKPAPLRPCLENGEALCEAFEIFREWEPSSSITFDQAALLAKGIARCEDVSLGCCSACGRAVVLDLCAKRRDQCPSCRKKSSKAGVGP